MEMNGDFCKGRAGPYEKLYVLFDHSLLIAVVEHTKVVFTYSLDPRHDSTSFNFNVKYVNIRCCACLPTQL